MRETFVDLAIDGPGPVRPAKLSNVSGRSIPMHYLELSFVQMLAFGLVESSNDSGAELGYV